MKFNIKPEVFLGSGVVNRLKDINLGRVMLVADPFLIDNGMIGLITDVLDEINLEYVIFSDIVPDTPLTKVTAGVKLMEEFKPTDIIVVGGGSAIDTSKAIKYFNEKIDKRGIDVRLIVIPTTSGTGSEATRYAVVLNEETNLKHTIMDESILPDFAVLDMDFIRSVPNSVVIASGLDVLVHGLEAYVARGANDLTDMFALKAIKDVFNYLPKVVETNDQEAREKMHLASLLAGIAFENAGLGINHSIAHVLGGEYGIAHGRVNAIILPYVVRYNGERMEDNKYLKLADELGVPGLGRDIKFNNLIMKMEKLATSLGVASSLSEMDDIKIDFDEYKSRLDEMARIAYKDGNTATSPILPTEEDLKGLLLEIYKGN